MPRQQEQHRVRAVVEHRPLRHLPADALEITDGLLRLARRADQVSAHGVARAKRRLRRIRSHDDQRHVAIGQAAQEIQIAADHGGNVPMLGVVRGHQGLTPLIGEQPPCPARCPVSAGYATFAVHRWRATASLAQIASDGRR